MKNEKELFKQACFSNNLQDFYRECVNKKTIGIQNLYVYKEIFNHRYWNVTRTCSFSFVELNEENFDFKISYWYPFIWTPVRKDLKEKSIKQIAYECQKIDKSCNDCANLDRQKDLCKIKNIKVNSKLFSNTCMPNNENCFRHRLD